MGTNGISASVSNGTLTMKVKLDPKGLSSKGKPLLASTHGFADVPNTDLRISLNVVKRSERVTLGSLKG